MSPVYFTSVFVASNTLRDNSLPYLVGSLISVLSCSRFKDIVSYSDYDSFSSLLTVSMFIISYFICVQIICILFYVFILRPFFLVTIFLWLFL